MKSLLLEPAGLTTRAHPRAGWIARIKGRQFWVDFPGNVREPLPARFLAGVLPNGAPAEGQPVLLLFENDDPELPIVAGVICDSLDPIVSTVKLPVSKPAEAVVDGTRVVLDAKDEIELRCGRSSLTLRSDGRIVLRGVEIVSRASGANKIKGAAVKIN